MPFLAAAPMAWVGKLIGQYHGSPIVCLRLLTSQFPRWLGHPFRFVIQSFDLLLAGFLYVSTLRSVQRDVQRLQTCRAVYSTVSRRGAARELLTFYVGCGHVSRLGSDLVPIDAQLES